MEAAEWCDRRRVVSLDGEAQLDPVLQEHLNNIRDNNNARLGIVAGPESAPIMATTTSVFTTFAIILLVWKNTPEHRNYLIKRTRRRKVEYRGPKAQYTR